MAFFLGVDTGGTYTDAVIVDEAADRVIGKAKSLTTRARSGAGHRAGGGCGAGGGRGGARREVALVSLSTTLATNALVEGQGGRVALVFIGFDDGDLDRGGLTEALKGDPVIRLAGGHSHAGQRGGAAGPGRAGGGRWPGLADQVMGFAVAARFATRNPAHEMAARDADPAGDGAAGDLFARACRRKLNGPKRALTAVLNARLIGMIDRLVAACERHLALIGIDGAADGGARRRRADLGGDGARTADRDHPVRPRRQHRRRALADRGDGCAGVATSAAPRPMWPCCADGLPEIDPQGARVGGFRTMVEAVAMRTTGLGGDSEVHLLTEGLEGGLRLGPRRLIPVSLLAVDHGPMVHAALDRGAVGGGGGRVGRALRGADGRAGRRACRRARRRCWRGSPSRCRWRTALTSRLEVAALERLVARGLVMIVGRDAVGCQPCAGAAGGLGRGGGGKGAAAAGAAAQRARATGSRPDAGGAGAGHRRPVDRADGGLPAGGGLWRGCRPLPGRRPRRWRGIALTAGRAGAASRRGRDLGRGWACR